MQNNTLKSLMLASALAIPGVSQASDESKWKWSFDAGYQFLTLGDRVSYNHTVHPDDAGFLPKNAGKTSIKNIHSGNLNLGIFREYPHFEPYLSGGLTILGARDRKQNDGDKRPAANGSFIYTKAFILGGNLELGSRVKFTEKSPVYLKAGVKVDVFSVESGWDRWGHDQTAHSQLYTPLSAAAGIGIKTSEGTCIEATFYKGISKSINYGAGISVKAKF